MKKDWIYQIRGLAIIAVVVCHQQYILHESETVQMLSLYSVTTLIFLLGITKAISLKKHYSANVQPTGILAYSLKSMMPVLCAYVVATLAYSSDQIMDFNYMLSQILNFSVPTPAYFIKYYIILSLYAPLLYSAIKYVLYENLAKYYRICALVLLFVLIWLVGYGSIGRLDIFGQSYFFVYSLGLLFGQIEIHDPKTIYIIPAMTVLFGGLISTKQFYFAKVAGVYDYSGGINFLAPKLQMNPPNISIILYSAGVIGTAYLFFNMCNKSKTWYGKMLGQPFALLGKYSVDIFLWHLFIQKYLNMYFGELNQGVCKCLIYYSSMLLIPVFVRFIYNKIKWKTYELLKL